MLWFKCESVHLNAMQMFEMIQNAFFQKGNKEHTNLHKFNKCSNKCSNVKHALLLNKNVCQPYMELFYIIRI